MTRFTSAHARDWRRELKTFAAGAGCGFLAGALLVATLLWQYNWIVLPWSQRNAAVAESPTLAEASRIDGAERPAATAGKPATNVPMAEAAIGPAPASPDELMRRDLIIPVEGVRADQLTRQFSEVRGGSRAHEALDILAPRNTPVKAVEDGLVAKLFYSKAGGITVYQFDPSSTFCYYYAHLEGYAEGLREGDRVRKGQVIGYVGTSGNAPKTTPHLHFAIFRLTDAKRWWEGTPIDPYDVLR